MKNVRQQITLFCFPGQIHKNIDKIRKEVKSLNSSNYQICINHVAQTDNGRDVRQSCININIFGPEAGRRLITDLCKKVADKENDLITIDYLDESLRKQLCNLPDPDVFLYFNKVCGMFGYIPWQLRLTEFIDFGSLKGITPTLFVKVLYAYANCEQRFGK